MATNRFRCGKAVRDRWFRGLSVQSLEDRCVLAAPVINVDDLVYREITAGGNPVVIDATATLNDPDGDADWNGGELSIKSTGGQATDELSVVPSGNITLDSLNGEISSSGTHFATADVGSARVNGDTKLTIIFNTNATNARVEELLRTISFQAAMTPSADQRIVEFTAKDTDFVQGEDQAVIQVIPQTGTTGQTGSATPINVVQPYQALNYYIAVEGTFPPQNLSAVEPYLGSVSMFAGNFAPRGWLPANGQLLPIDSNQALFSILGNRYGGDGETSFALPDLRGRVPIGVGTGPDGQTYVLGQKVGAETVTLTEQNLPSHTHSISEIDVEQTDPVGQGQPFDNRQPALALTPVIAADGVFPSQSLTGNDLVGSVGWFAGDFVPRGYYRADGQEIPINVNTTLFAILGTNFGGDGEDTLGLPDLRGRTPIHAGQGAGLSNIPLSQKGGLDAVSISAAQLANHSHRVADSPVIESSSSGGNQPINVRSPYIALNYAIALTGVLPSQTLESDDEVASSAGARGFLSGTEVLDDTVALQKIDELVEAGIRIWEALGITDSQVEILESAEVAIAELSQNRLAWAGDDSILIDNDAAGRGWFVDATPWDNVEFANTDPRTGELVATEIESIGYFDLLTTILHEQGHLLGLAHADEPGQLMHGGLNAGSRKLPTSTDLLHFENEQGEEDEEFLLGSLPLIGAVGMFAGTFAPTGWALTDGQILATSQNEALFSIIGSEYGGNATTTFGLPDLRGRTAPGVGSGAGLSTYDFGEAGGNQTITLSVNNLPSHAHTFTANFPPTVSVGDLDYMEGDNGGNPVAIDGAALANDMDGDADWDGGSLTVQITAGNEAADEISVLTVGSITVNTSNGEISSGGTHFATATDIDATVTNGTALTITFNANATNAIVQELVRSIGYRSTGNPSAGSRTATFTVTDQLTLEGSDTATINVTVVTDPPSVTVPSAPTTVNAASFDIQGTAEADATVRVYSDVNNNGAIDAGVDMVVASQTLSGGATSFSIATALTQDAANNFVVTAQVTNGTESTPTDVPTITEESVSPTVTSVLRQTPTDELTNGDEVTFRVTFDEDVQNVDALDFTLSGTASPAGTILAPLMVGADAAVYDITVIGLAASNGTVDLDFAAGQNITDLVGNSLVNTTPGIEETYTIDNTVPIADSFTRMTPLASATNADSLTFRVTFSEDVSGVGNSDFVALGATAAINVARVLDDVYDVTLSAGDLANVNGTVGLAFDSPSITDLAGNALPNNPPTINETYELDNLAPDPVISSSEPDPTFNNAFDVTIDFGESVSAPPPVSIQNATNTNLVDDGNGQFTLSLSVVNSGTVTVDVLANVVTDDAGNSNLAATPFNIDVNIADFGDAPTLAQSGFANDYPTTLVNSGAYHLIDGPRLGASVDRESNGQPTLNADGDDLAGSDEDGVTFGGLAVSASAGTASSLQVDLQNADGTSNRLDAWIDFNRNGSWDDAGEQIVTDFDLGTTDSLLTIPFSIPQDIGSNIDLGDTYARVRLSTAGGLSPTGPSTDGEVEDYRITLSDVSATTTIDLPTVDPPGTELITVVSLTNGGTDFTVTSGGVIIYQVPLADLPNDFGINGSDEANDTLVLDGTNGIPTSGIHFDGGGGVDGIDIDNLPGAFQIPLGADGSGLILYQGQPIINFSNLEPIDFTSGSTPTTLEISIDPMDSVVGLITATVSNHPTPGVSQITFDNGLESVVFPTPTVSLTIIGDPNDSDQIIVDSLDASWNVPITIQGSGGGTDAVNLPNGIVLGGGDLTIDATDVVISDTVTTAGGNIEINALGIVDIAATGRIETTHGNLAITAANLIQTANGSEIDTGAGLLRLISDSFVLGGAADSISGADTLSIAPLTPTNSIGLGGGAGVVNLDDAELATFEDGFSSITIGDPVFGTGLVDIDSVTLADDVSIAGGSIELSELNVGSNHVDLIAQTGLITTPIALPTDVIAGTLTASGTLAPGASPGVLDVNGNLVFANGSAFSAEINGELPGDSAGNHDQIIVEGDVHIGSNVNLVLNGSLIADSPTTITLIDNRGTNPITGQFAGLMEGDSFLINLGGTSTQATISYLGGDNNDVVLELATVPVYDFTLAVNSVDETDSTFATNVVTLIRSVQTTIPTSVDVVLTGDTATAGSDFVAGPITINFAAGETLQTVPIEILGDTLVEADETLDLSLTNFTGGGTSGTAQPTSILTVTNDDSATISIDNVGVVESNSLVFTITMSNLVDVVTTLQADTSSGSAGVNDFTPLVGETVTFPVGSQTQTVAVQSTADFLSEIDESFFVNLSNINAGGRDVTFADNQGRGTIIDIPLLAIDDVTVVEGDSGVTTAMVPARLSEALPTPLFVQYEVQEGTATASEDYFTMSGNFTIPAGDTNFDFPISIAGDEIGEANERFTVIVKFLDSPGNVVAAGDSRAVVTIQNDDGLNVVGVKVGSTDWDPSFRAFVDPTSADFGYPIPTGAAQLAPLPWANINQIQLEFNSDISSSFAENLFGLGGFHTADYHTHITSTVYNASDFTVTMTLDTFLGDDQLVVVASDLLTFASGDALDGEWTTGQASNVSGDGNPGGAFEFRFDVLPGDVDQSGGLSSNDGFAALRLQSHSIGDINYVAAADMDGSGSINSNDGFFALARQSTELPKGTPTVPPLPHAAKVDLAVAALAGIHEDDEPGKLTLVDDMDGIVDEFAAELYKL